MLKIFDKNEMDKSCFSPFYRIIAAHQTSEQNILTSNFIYFVLTDKMVLYFILPQGRCTADCFKDFRTFLKEALKNKVPKKNRVFATNSIFLIPLSLQPNHGRLWVNLNSNWTNSLHRSK